MTYLNIFKITSLFIFGAGFSACDSQTKFQPPANVLSEWCSTKLKMSNASLYCTESDFAESPSVNSSLVVFIEAGTVQANSVTTSPFSDIMKNPEISMIAPHIRTIIGNIAAAFIEKNQLKYSRYDSIYVVQGDSNLKNRFLSALQVAINKSQKVDLFMIGHGAPGLFYMNQNLSSSSEVLTGNDIIQFSKTFSADSIAKIKNIFSTACFSATASATSKSVAKGFKEAFPQSNGYGGSGVNYFPLHRDFSIFEEFQRSQNFESSVALGNRAISTNIFSSSARKYLTYPSVRGRGCVDLILTEKCKEMVLPMGTMTIAQWQINDSLAKITTADLVLATPVQAPPPPTPMAIPACSDWRSQQVLSCVNGIEYGRITGCLPPGYKDPALWKKEGEQIFSHMTGSICGTITPTAPINICAPKTGDFANDDGSKTLWSCGCPNSPDSRAWVKQPANDCYHLKLSCVTTEGSFTNGLGGKTAYVCGCNTKPDQRAWVSQPNKCYHLNL